MYSNSLKENVFTRVVLLEKYFPFGTTFINPNNVPDSFWTLAFNNMPCGDHLAICQYIAKEVLCPIFGLDRYEISQVIYNPNDFFPSRMIMLYRKNRGCYFRFQIGVELTQDLTSHLTNDYRMLKETICMAWENNKTYWHLV